MKQSIDHKPPSELVGDPAGVVQIDPRCVPPSAATVAQWLSWSAPTDNSDSDAGTLSDERGD